MKALLLAVMIPFGTYIPWTNPIPESFYESKSEALENAYDAGTKTCKDLNTEAGVKSYCDSIDWSKYDF